MARATTLRAFTFLIGGTSTRPGRAGEIVEAEPPAESDRPAAARR
jgi:hypothetical protein